MLVKMISGEPHFIVSAEGVRCVFSTDLSGKRTEIYTLTFVGLYLIYGFHTIRFFVETDLCFTGSA